MGNSFITQTRKQLNSQQYNWVVVSTTPYSTKVIDKHTQLLAEKHHVQYSLLKQEWETYLLRHKHPQYLVSIYDIMPEYTQNICSTNQQISIIIQQIPYRLSDLGQLEVDEGIYVLNSILLAFRILKENNFEFYLIDETNICFNKKGKCKIWINEVLSLGRPSQNRRVSEMKFVNSILELIQQRVNDNIFTNPLTNRQLQNISIQKLLSKIQKQNKNILTSIASLSNMDRKTSRTKLKVPNFEKKYSTPESQQNQRVTEEYYPFQSNSKFNQQKAIIIKSQQPQKVNNLLYPSSTPKKVSLAPKVKQSTCKFTSCDKKKPVSDNMDNLPTKNSPSMSQFEYDQKIQTYRKHPKDSKSHLIQQSANRLNKTNDYQPQKLRFSYHSSSNIQFRFK